MGNPFKKVQRGQKLEIPAEAFNTFIDAALDFKNRQRSQGQESTSSRPSSTLIKVRNQTGQTRNRFDVVALVGPIIQPASNEQAFQNEPALDGVVPTLPEHSGRFAILHEPVAAGEIAHRACVSGVTVARVNVTNERHRHADIANGTCDYLQSCDAGGAIILWKEPGTGVKWAIVRIGNDDQDICRFELFGTLAKCGHASARKILYGNSRWCDGNEIITVYDSLGITPAAGLYAGTFGWAVWMPDSGKWELLFWGEGCCGSGGVSDSSVRDSSRSDSSQSSDASASSGSAESQSWSGSAPPPPPPPSSGSVISSAYSSVSSSSSVSSASSAASLSSASSQSSSSGSPSGSGSGGVLRCGDCSCTWLWHDDLQLWELSFWCWHGDPSNICLGCMCDPPSYPGSGLQTAMEPCYAV